MLKWWLWWFVSIGAVVAYGVVVGTGIYHHKEERTSISTDIEESLSGRGFGEDQFIRAKFLPGNDGDSSTGSLLARSSGQFLELTEEGAEVYITLEPPLDQYGDWSDSSVTKTYQTFINKKSVIMTWADDYTKPGWTVTSYTDREVLFEWNNLGHLAVIVGLPVGILGFLLLIACIVFLAFTLSHPHERPQVFR